MSKWHTKDMARIASAELEAVRFQQRVRELRQAIRDNPESRNPVERGALRRASMDLTRALAKMRKPVYG